MHKTSFEGLALHVVFAIFTSKRQVPMKKRFLTFILSLCTLSLVGSGLLQYCPKHQCFDLCASSSGGHGTGDGDR